MSSTVFTQPPGSFVLIGKNADRTVAYTCDPDLVTIDSFIRFETPYVYDLQYPCATPLSWMIAMQDVSENLLNAAADEYGILPPGNGCAVPPKGYGQDAGSGYGDGERSNWIAGLFSSTPDELVPNVKCLSDTTDTECCVVVEGSMQFQPSGGFDGDEFRDFVSSTLNRRSFTSVETFNTSFRGAAIDYTYSPGEDARDQLAEGPRGPTVSAIGNEQPSSQPDDGKVTYLGGALLSGLVVATIGALFIVFRRRRRSRFDDHDLEEAASDVDAESQDALQLEVLSDGNHSPRRSQEHYADSPSPRQAYEYKFDLGNSMKNDVMGTYGGGGPTSNAVMSGEVSDNGSEVDSWAQTDGTVGSLEDNLDELTAEI
jgi:hypothetical protein